MIVQSIAGLIIFSLIAWAISENRRQVRLCWLTYMLHLMDVTTLSLLRHLPKYVSDGPSKNSKSIVSYQLLIFKTSESGTDQDKIL